jgi:hypothetical protein
VKDETVGDVVSTTNALDPATLLALSGIVFEVIAFPAVSRTEPMENEVTVRLDEVSVARTVYVPLNVVPADGAVKRTVRFVFRVAVMVLPDRTVSLAVAVMLMVCPALKAPFAVVDEKDAMVGAVVSTTTLLESAMFAPLGKSVDVIALPAPSATVPMVKLSTFNIAAVWPAAIV